MKILYWAGWSLTHILGKPLFGWRVSGREHMPREGGFIVATNHISYFDPLLVGSSLPREVFFFAKQELFSVPVLGWAIRRTNARPVKRGTVDRSSLKTAIETIRQGYGLTVFPEGTRSKTDQFLEPKAGLGLIARHAECPILPGYVHGANNLKACFWRRDRIRTVFGEPFTADWVKSFGNSKEDYLAMSRAVMDRIAELRQQVVG